MDCDGPWTSRRVSASEWTKAEKQVGKAWAGVDRSLSLRPSRMLARRLSASRGRLCSSSVCVVRKQRSGTMPSANSKTTGHSMISHHSCIVGRDSYAGSCGNENTIPPPPGSTHLGLSAPPLHEDSLGRRRRCLAPGESPGSTRDAAFLIAALWLWPHYALHPGKSEEQRCPRFIGILLLLPSFGIRNPPLAHLCLKKG